MVYFTKISIPTIMKYNESFLELLLGGIVWKKNYNSVMLSMHVHRHVLRILYGLFFLCELTCMAPKQNFLSCTVFSQVCQGITLVYPPVDMRNVYIALLHPTATETKRAERHWDRACENRGWGRAPPPRSRALLGSRRPDRNLLLNELFFVSRADGRNAPIVPARPLAHSMLLINYFRIMWAHPTFTKITI